MQIKQSELEAFLIDPVMAAYVIMNIELDVFQASRLRTFWWVPEVVDSSGISTGKSIVQFIYVNLRCILLTDHVAGIYFPNWQTMKDEWWPYFQRTMDEAPIFREQFVFHHGKLGEHRYPGAYVMDYKNKSRCVAPAPSFMTDSNTQASRRFNTLVVDEWLEAENMGEAISKILVDRVSRSCFNKKHPVWCNHLKFLGHAESPSHKGYNRVRNYRRAIVDGSQRYALISFNYRDWTPKFAKKYREDEIIKSQKVNLTSDQFERNYLGIWSRNGSAYYSGTTMQRNLRADIQCVLVRRYRNEINQLGFDVAPGKGKRADYSAGMVYRMVEINDELKEECAERRIFVPPVTRVHEGRQFNCAFIYAAAKKHLRASELAAFIHFLHRVFAFSNIVLDPGGGGLFVYEELIQETQIIGGIPVKVTPLCTRDEGIMADKQPIVSFFSRGSALSKTVNPNFLVSDEGFLQATHARYAQSWEAGEHHWPLQIEDRSPNEVKGWDLDQFWSHKTMDEGLKQLENVRQVTDDDGNVKKSKRGFTMFDAKGKKDVAYSSLYAHAAGELWLTESLEDQEEEGENCMAVSEE